MYMNYGTEEREQELHNLKTTPQPQFNPTHNPHTPRLTPIDTGRKAQTPS